MQLETAGTKPKKQCETVGIPFVELHNKNCSVLAKSHCKVSLTIKKLQHIYKFVICLYSTSVFVFLHKNQIPKGFQNKLV